MKNVNLENGKELLIIAIMLSSIIFAVGIIQNYFFMENLHEVLGLYGADIKGDPYSSHVWYIGYEKVEDAAQQGFSVLWLAIGLLVSLFPLTIMYNYLRKSAKRITELERAMPQ